MNENEQILDEQNNANNHVDNNKSSNWCKWLLCVFVFFVIGFFVGCGSLLLISMYESKHEAPFRHIQMDDKPVIYLYPEEETDVDVNLSLDGGKFTCTYPEYKNGWHVTAKPDGTLYDSNGQSYNYLYWEAESDTDFDFSTGYCIKGADTAVFLEEKLLDLGLTRKEANEFIIYWLPRMEQNNYNVISFQTDVYTDYAKLDINPQPDTLIRVYMAYYGSDKAVDIDEPEKEIAPKRDGFTVVEWGGSKVCREYYDK